MAGEATIDSLMIEIDSDSNSAMQGLENLVNRLEKLRAAVSPLAGGNSGLSKLQKQIQQLQRTTSELQNITGIDKLTQLAESLRNFSNVSGNTNLNPLINSLRRIPEAVNAISAMPRIDRERIESLTSALAPLQTLGGNANLDSFVNSLRRIPQVAQDLQNTDIDSFASEIQRLTDAMRPLAEEMAQVAQGFSALPQEVQQYIRRSDGASSSTRGLSATLGNLRLSVLAAFATLRRLYGVLADCFDISNQFIENLNLFTVTMGESADEAYAFAEAVNEALGIDTSDWIRYQGFFQSIAKGFGTTAEQADLMSKNLTQLSYDIASFYNVSVEEAYNKVVSGFSGELEPLRRLGFALDEATLKQLAYKKGIEQSVEGMTQAQKGQLRYVAMIEQAGSIGVLGDMSRTIDTASNGLRILQARIQQFARAVGNVVAPVLSAVLPYFTAFIQLMTEAANELATLFGFELPEIDISATAVTGGFDDITAAVDDATGSVEKFKGSLAGVDQLNIIGSTSQSGGNGEATGAFDLGIELPTYDFLGDVQNETKAIFESMKDGLREVLPWIEAVGAAIAGLYIGNGLINATTWIGRLADRFRTLRTIVGANGVSNLFGIAGGLAAGASSGALFYNSIKNLITGTGDLKNNLAQLEIALGISLAAIAGFIAVGNPVGAVITGVVAGIGLLVGAIEGANVKIEEQNRLIEDTVLYNNGGTKITEIATAFNNWADAASAVNRETIDKYKQLDTYEQQISDTLDVLDELGGTNIDLNSLTSVDAEALKEPFNELVRYLNEDFTESTKAIAQSTAEAFANLGISESVGAQVQIAYKRMQNMFDESLSESQKLVQDYFTRIEGGEILSTEEVEDFEKRYQFVLDSARIGDKDYQNLQAGLAELSKIDFTNISLEDYDTAQAALGEMLAAYSSYKTSAEEALRLEFGALEDARKQVQLSYDYGYITEQDYQGYLDVLKTSAAALFADYDKTRSDINSQLAPIISQLSTEFINAASQQNPTFKQMIETMVSEGTLFSAGGVLSVYNSYDYAVEDWLQNNEAYQNLIELEKLVDAPIPVDLMVDMTYDPSSPYAAIFEALGGTPLKVPVELVSYSGDNDQYKQEWAGVYDGHIPSTYEVIPDFNTPTVTLPDFARGTQTGISPLASAMQGNKTENQNAAINIEVYPTVEIDGEELAGVTSRFNVTQNYKSNGRYNIY